MKIRNKLFIINVAVFLLFVVIFSIFLFSSVRLLKLKDLEREVSIVRNRILKLEYANQIVLNGNEAPVHILQWAGQNVSDALDDLTLNDSLKFLDPSIFNKINNIRNIYYGQEFNEYFRVLSKDLSAIRSHLYGTSLELRILDMEDQNGQDDPLYDALKKIKNDVSRFIVWHRPLSDSFVSVSNDIIREVQGEISSIILQTGITLFIGILLSILLIFSVYRNMVNKLNLVSRGITTISSGDLLTRIEVKSNDELATIGLNFNTLTETIWQKLNNIGSIIHNMGQSLSSEAETMSLEHTILNLAIENTHADSGALFIPDRRTRMITCPLKSDGFAAPYNESEYELSFPYGKTVIGITALSGEPLNLQKMDDQKLVPQRGIFDRGYISSCLILPLVSEKTVIAVLCLEKNNENQFFSDMDYRNIQSFVEFSAITMSNLSKYTELLESSGLNREMEIASDIQKSLLPPRLPKVPSFDITVRTYSQKGISGEIYDFFPLGENRWLFCLAQVMEKGIASSMLLVILRTLVRILVKSDQEPAEMLNNILENFHDTTGLNIPLKISLILMEPDKKLFHFCGTEDEKIIIYDQTSGISKLITAQQKSSSRFISISGSLRKDVFLVSMTDGFHNVSNESGNLYGWNPAQEILKKHSDRSLEWIQEAINKDVSFFERHLGQRDDRTLFIARFKGDLK